jgi:hypothetical protein
MKSLIYAAIAASVLAAPAVSFAQQSNNGPMTRAEVRAQLVQLENAGYHPSLSDPHYPDNLEAAEARVAAENGTAQATAAQAPTGSYGSSTSGSSQSSARVADNGPNSIYFGH